MDYIRNLILQLSRGLLCKQLFIILISNDSKSISVSR
jgi:hypothetical protein